MKIIGIHSRCPETLLHRNNETSIKDFITDVMDMSALMFFNMRLHSLIKINFSKIKTRRCEGKTNLH